MGHLRAEAPFEVWALERIGKGDALLDIVEGRVVSVWLEETEEFLCQFEALLCALLGL